MPCMHVPSKECASMCVQPHSDVEAYTQGHSCKIVASASVCSYILRETRGGSLCGARTLAAAVAVEAAEDIGEDARRATEAKARAHGLCKLLRNAQDIG